MLTLFLLLISLFCYGQSRMLDENEKIEAVRIHNFLRRSVVPPASNMKELEYSDAIALVASQYGEKCTFTHMYGPQGYGENGRLSSDANVTRTVMNWFQERVYYDWNKPYGERCYVRNVEDNYLSTASCGHYTMLATYTLTKVGCAINYCPKVTIPNGDNINDVYLTFCFYDKGPRDLPYSPGKPCTGCDDMSFQYCRDGLCVKKSTPNSDCKVVCKRCQKIPTWISGMCGCECDAGNNNDCSGYNKYAKDPSNCTPCNSLGTPCLNNGKDISINRDQCKCNCPDGFSGENCEITPSIATNLQNSATINVYGDKWYFGLRFPVDKYEFERKWITEYKGRIERDIESYCKINPCGTVSDTSDKITVDMVKDYPILNERGTLILQIYAKKNGQYINKEIIQDVVQKNVAKETAIYL